MNKKEQNVVRNMQAMKTHEQHLCDCNNTNRYDLGEQLLAKTKAKLDFTTSAHLFVEFRNKYLEGNSNIIELVLETKVHKTFGSFHW